MSRQPAPAAEGRPFMDRDPIFQSIKAARAAGIVGSRFEVVGIRSTVNKKQGIHAAITELCKRYGMHVVSSSSGTCCLPCRGLGWVDDGTALGCVRSTMRCPSCLGRGGFNMPGAAVETRPDGWPLCPECGEDELGCMSTPQPPDYEWTLTKYLEHELFCYRCARVTWQPS